MLIRAILLASLLLPSLVLAQDDTCDRVHPALASAALGGDVLRVVETRELTRLRHRPFHRTATGVELTVDAPAGVTAADIHKALRCGSSGGPLAVEGATLRVQRRGAQYRVTITHRDAAQAREIQRRAAAL